MCSIYLLCTYIKMLMFHGWSWIHSQVYYNTKCEHFCWMKNFDFFFLNSILCSLTNCRRQRWRQSFFFVRISWCSTVNTILKWNLFQCINIITAAGYTEHHDLNPKMKYIDIYTLGDVMYQFYQSMKLNFGVTI